MLEGKILREKRKFSSILSVNEILFAWLPQETGTGYQAIWENILVNAVMMTLDSEGYRFMHTHSWTKPWHDSWLCVCACACVSFLNGELKILLKWSLVSHMALHFAVFSDSQWKPEFQCEEICSFDHLVLLCVTVSLDIYLVRAYKFSFVGQCLFSKTYCNKNNCITYD